MISPDKVSRSASTAPPAGDPILEPVRPTHRWRMLPPGDALARALPGVHPLVARALGGRGIADAAAARGFLDRTVGDDNPFRLAGMDAAVTRLRRAVRAGEPIAIYGDYDADGVTATAVLVETLTALGATGVRTFIPHRGRDGYGVHAAALAALADQGTRVVVTVDCGIRAGAEIAAVARRGIDVIVTDHHALPAELPEAVAVINPRRPDCAYGFGDLAGVGLAYKLAQALLRVEARTSRRGGLGLAEIDLLDLVALGTVADMVPLVGENRALAHRGIETLRAARRPGVQALVRAARLDAARLTARDIGFGLGPRLNAAGRMDDAQVALDLLLARDAPAAERRAAELEARNTERREIMSAAVDAAEARLRGGGARALLFDASTEVPLGVLGLVAGRLAERYYRPSAILRIEGDLARGSARSIPEFDITAALDAAADILVRYGGHARAAGFTVRTADIPALQERLAAMASRDLDGVDLRPTLDIAAEVAPADLTWDLFDALEALEPFGEGNPRPLFLLAGARIDTRRAVGAGGQHLKLAIDGGRGIGSLGAIAFNRGAEAPRLGARADLVFSLRADVWQDHRRLELRVEDLASPEVARD